MKLTKSQLKQIIKEELESVLHEESDPIVQQSMKLLNTTDPEIFEKALQDPKVQAELERILAQAEEQASAQKVQERFDGGLFGAGVQATLWGLVIGAASSSAPLSATVLTAAGIGMISGAVLPPLGGALMAYYLKKKKQQ